MEQKLSKNGIRYMKLKEGIRLKAYTDQAGLLTIGVGHKLMPHELKSGFIVIRGKGIRWDKGLSQQQAEDLFDQDNDNAERVIKKFVKVPLIQNQFDALVSFVFNVGIDAFIKSTLLKKLNAGDYAAVPDQLKRWNKITDPKTKDKVASDGLIARRKADAMLWSGGFQT